MEPSSNQDPDSMEQVLKHSILPKTKLAMIVESEEGTQYCCVQCPMKYDTKEKLEVHLCTHFKELRYLCGICGTGLKRKEHLDRHVLGHQGVRPYVCQECGKGFKRKEHLNIHRSIHTGDKNQVCPLCQRSFYRKDHLQKHLQTHNKMFIEQNIYPLNDQELMDIKQEALDEDVKPVIDEELGCEVNMVEMEEPSQKSLASPVISSDPQRPYGCAVCGKTYKRKDHLKFHSQTHLRKKACSECGKAFHREDQLLAHMSIHLRSYSLHQDEETMESDLPQTDDMVDHSGFDILPLEEGGLMVPRADGRPHECAVCRRRFKRKQHLKVHANVHLKPSAAVTIWCSLCNDGFRNNVEFGSHRCSGGAPAAPCDAKKENDYPTDIHMIPIREESTAEYYQEQNIPTPQRVYVCKYCNKPFKRKDHYKIHLHIHTGIKSFFCPDCGKGFYRKDHLQKHLQVHSKTKQKPRRSPPPLYPIAMLPPRRPAHPARPVRPEITITAPSNTKLRVPLQIKVPYQVVTSDGGEQRAVTIDPQSQTTGKLPDKYTSQ